MNDKKQSDLHDVWLPAEGGERVEALDVKPAVLVNAVAVHFHVYHPEVISKTEDKSHCQ